MDIKIDIGKRLQELRKLKPLSQEECCEALGFTRSVLSSIEIGKRSLNLEEIQPILTFFNISLEDLLSESLPKKMKVNSDILLNEYIKLSKELNKLNLEYGSKWFELSLLKTGRDNVIHKLAVIKMRMEAE